MKVLLAVSLVVLALLSWVFQTQISEIRSTVQDQQKQIRTFQEKLTKDTNAAQYDLQEKCANQAQRDFQSSGYKQASATQAGETVDFSNHYNSELKKCLILVEGVNFKQGDFWTHKTLSDANERKIYGSYLWSFVKGKEDNPPLECSVVMPSREVRKCTSSEEFDSLIESYMGK